MATANQAVGSGAGSTFPMTNDALQKAYDPNIGPAVTAMQQYYGGYMGPTALKNVVSQSFPDELATSSLTATAGTVFASLMNFTAGTIVNNISVITAVTAASTPHEPVGRNCQLRDNRQGARHFSGRSDGGGCCRHGDYLRPVCRVHNPDLGSVLRLLLRGGDDWADRCGCCHARNARARQCRSILHRAVCNRSDDTSRCGVYLHPAHRFGCGTAHLRQLGGGPSARTIPSW